MGLFTGLGFSQLINGKSRALGGIYTRAYNDLIRDMNDFAKTPFARERAAAMLARVDDTVRRLDAQTRAFVQKEVPATYFATANAVKGDIKKLKIRVPEAFSQIHFEAANAIAEDAMLKFGHTMTGIKRSAEEVVKFSQQKSIREIIGAGQLEGAAAKEISKQVQAKIAEDRITVLIDRGGKKWDLDVYAEMLTRQMLANSGRDGVLNMAAEFKLDLAIITTHGSAHEECRVWEGKVVSLTGKTPGFPTLQDAIDAGLLHVGCKHGYTITAGIVPDSPADLSATLEEDHMGGGESGDEIPFGDKKTLNAFKDMQYEPPTDMTKIQYVTTADGTKYPTRFGNLHRWVDDQELQSIIDTGKLSTTPENTALEGGGAFFGRPGHKDFDVSPDGSSGKVFLDTLRSTSTYEGQGMHHLILNVEDLPKGAQLLKDPKTSFSVMVNQDIPRKNISLVESIGSQIVPGSSIDWRKVSFDDAPAPITQIKNPLLLSATASK